MSWIGVAVGGLGIGASIYSANQKKDAANNASKAQIQSAQMGIDEQRRQFDQIQKLLSPYVTAGNSALSAQLGILGLNGNDAQGKAYDAVQNSDAFKIAAKQGETGILQNASALGDFGGNAVNSLERFRPQLLQDLVQRQFQNLGGIVNTGQASAAGTATAVQNTWNAAYILLGEQGAAKAGAYVAKANADADMWNGISSTLATAGRAGGLF